MVHNGLAQDSHGELLRHDEFRKGSYKTSEVDEYNGATCPGPSWHAARHGAHCAQCAVASAHRCRRRRSGCTDFSMYKL